MTNKLDTAALRRVAEAATPGPWRQSPHAAHHIDGPNGHGIGKMFSGNPNQDKHPDTELAVAARNALPALLDRIEALEQAIARINSRALGDDA